MTAIGVAAPPVEIAEREAVPRITAQTGAASFSDLVRAHFRREQERKNDKNGVASDEAEAEYEAKLEEFQEKEGEIAAVYWSTGNASAVAMTIGQPRGERNPFTDTETEVRLHRVTDWVTKDRSQIADLLHESDLLAIRVGVVLRGASERITMRWIFAVQQHLLGFFERMDEFAPTAAATNGSLWSLGKTWHDKRRSRAEVQREERRLVEAQRKELMKVEDYYLRIASKTGRIVYVSGMLMGAVVIVLLGALIAVALAYWYPKGWTGEVQNLLLCTGAGAVGALTSVLSRMSGGGGTFTVDVEVGRPLLRRLGLYKPLVGSVFGVALYFLLASGLLMTKAPQGRVMYFYGIVAFFSGFSERFTGVVFGGAQRLITGEAKEGAASGTNAQKDDAAETKASEDAAAADAKTRVPAARDRPALIRRLLDAAGRVRPRRDA
jgi:hypothetical protein